MGNVALVEVVWTIVCSFTLIYMLRLLNRALEDWRYIAEEGVIKMAARTKVYFYANLSIQEILKVIAGVTLITVPPLGEVVSATTYVVAATFLVTSAFAALNAFLTDKSDLEIRRKLRNA